MDNLEKLKSTDKFKAMCEEFCQNSIISQSLYNKFGVKRGLRNSDGSRSEERRVGKECRL